VADGNHDEHHDTTSTKAEVACGSPREARRQATVVNVVTS